MNSNIIFILRISFEIAENNVQKCEYRKKLITEIKIWIEFWITYDILKCKYIEFCLFKSFF